MFGYHFPPRKEKSLETSTKNNSTGASKVKSVETHDWQFQGTFIPARVLNLMRDKQINGTDLILICIIGALVRHEPDGSGVGCYASNEYLANCTSCYPTYISERINHLKRLGVLISITMEESKNKYKNKQRYLELSWSRSPIELQGLSGKYGELIRAAHQTGEGVYKHLGSSKAEGVNTCPHSAKAEAIKTMSLTSEEKDDKEKGGAGGSRGLPAARPSPISSKNKEANTPSISPRQPSLRSGNGKGELPNKKQEGKNPSPKPAPASLRSAKEGAQEPTKNTPRIDSECLKWSETLRDSLRSSNRKFVDFNKETWTSHFRQLRDQIGTDPINKVLEFYCKNCSAEAQERLDLPQVSSAKAFVRLFSWIEGKMISERAKRKKIIDSNILPPEMRW